MTTSAMQSAAGRGVALPNTTPGAYAPAPAGRPWQPVAASDLDRRWGVITWQPTRLYWPHQAIGQVNTGEPMQASAENGAPPPAFLALQYGHASNGDLVLWASWLTPQEAEFFRPSKGSPAPPSTVPAVVDGFFYAPAPRQVRAGTLSPIHLAGPRTFGDPNADAAQQLASLGAFYAGVAAGQQPTPAQLASANSAVSTLQSDLNTLGGTPDPTAAKNAGGFTKMETAISVAVAIVAGYAVAKLIK